VTALLQASYLGSKSCCSENLRKNRLAGRFFRFQSKRLRLYKEDLKKILFVDIPFGFKPAPLNDTIVAKISIELIDFNEKKNRYYCGAQSPLLDNKINELQIYLDKLNSTSDWVCIYQQCS